MASDPGTYHRPDSLAQALRLLTERSPLVIAGGTDLLRAQESWPPARGLLDVSALPELHGIARDGAGWSLGAAVTWREAAASGLPAVLTEAAAAIGSPQVRATATVGGNLVSPWAAGDGLAALVCLGASVVIAAPAGERTEQLTQRLHLAPDELVTRVRIPATDGPSGYLRHSLRPGFGPPVLSVCVVRGSRPRTVVNRGAGPEQWADTASAGPGDAYQAALARTLLRRLLARVQA